MARVSRREACRIVASAASWTAFPFLFDERVYAKAEPPRVATQTRVLEMAGGLQIENDHLRATFRYDGTGVVQEYLVRDGSAAWLLMAKSFSIPIPRPDRTSPLYSDQGPSQRFRLLASNSFSQMRVFSDSANGLGIALFNGVNSPEQIVQTIAMRDDSIHIEVSAELPGNPARLEYLLSTFSFEGGPEPDFTHVPCMKRAADDVIGDRIFDSPAAVIQKGPLLLALVPDLDLLNSEVVNAKGARPVGGPRGFLVPQDPSRISFPAVLDLDLSSGMTEKPVFSFGFADFITESHVYWRHENRSGTMIRELSSNRLRYGFDLILSPDAPSFRGFQKATRFLWSHYGAKYLREPRPQVMPLAEYAKVCFPAAFAYRGDTTVDVKQYYLAEQYDSGKPGPLPTWLEFELNGRQVGGIRGTPTNWYADIQFSSWWNNARDAEGLFWWGERLKDAGLVEKARRIVNLALDAPQYNGIFPSVFRYSEKRWVGCYWNFPQGFDGNWRFPEKPDASAIPHFWDMNSGNYMPSAASLTACHLLRYQRLCEGNDRIIPYVTNYGEFLMNNVRDDGSIPAWFDQTLIPTRNLNFNADGGAHIWFLCELYRATHDQRFLATAKRMASFLLREVLPRQRWYDFETFYSCAAKPENIFDARTGQWPQCTLSMLWAIRGFTELARMTADSQFLSAAEAVADYSLFYQACWQPHFIITGYAFGGFRAQNSDAEWLDMRSSAFSEAFAALGELAHRQDLCERAVAALHAAFAAINHPRLIQNGIFPYPRYPIGIEPENIDHDGLPQDMLRSGFDWGEGGALTGAATLLRSMGGIFVDCRNNIAIGVDGVHVESCVIHGRTIALNFKNQLSELPFPWETGFDLELRMLGLEKGRYALVVNGGNPRTLSDSELERYPLRVV